MSVSGLVGLVLSLVMMLTSVGTPDQYGEISISDPVVRFSEYGEEFALDLTGLDFSLGSGVNGDGNDGVLSLGLGANGSDQSALLRVQDGAAVLCLDGLPWLLNMTLPTEEELNQFFVEYAGMSLEEYMAALTADTAYAPVSQADIIANLAASLDMVKCKERKTYQSQETFLNGAVTEEVTRTDFVMTAEQSRDMVMSLAKLMEESGEILDMDLTDLESLGGIEGTMCHSDDIFRLNGTLEIIDVDGASVPVPFDIFYYGAEDWQFYATAAPDANNSIGIAGAQQTTDGVATWDVVLSMTEEGETYEMLTLKGIHSSDDTSMGTTVWLSVDGEDLLTLSLNCQNTPEKLSLGGSLHINDGWSTMELEGYYDAAVTEVDGAKAHDGTLHFALQMDEYGDVMEMSLDCGLDFLTAPLSGYLAELPEGMRRVNLEEITDSELAQLQGAGLAFVAPMLTLPGIADLMAEEGIFYSAEDDMYSASFVFEDEYAMEEEAEDGNSIFGTIQKGIGD